MKPTRGAIAALLDGRHDDPFSLLGPHAGPDGTFVRAWIPSAETLAAYDLSGAPLGTLERTDERGLFEGSIDGDPQPITYHAAGGGGAWSVTDPYSFGPVLGPIDDLLIAEGTHLRLHDKLGAHPIAHEGADGVHFAVWAPNARRVSVVGDFNDWDARRHVMRRRGDIGVWEIFIPGVGPGRHYKFAILVRQWRSAAAEGGSLRLRDRIASRYRLHHHRPGRARLGRCGASRCLGRDRSAPRAD